MVTRHAVRYGRNSQFTVNTSTKKTAKATVGKSMAVADARCRGGGPVDPR